MDASRSLLLLLTFFGLGLSGCTNAIPKFTTESSSEKPSHVIQRAGARHDLATASFRLKGSMHYAAEESSILTTSNYKIRGAVKRGSQ